MKVLILDNSTDSVIFTFNGNMFTICKEENELYNNGVFNGLNMETEQDFEKETTTYNFGSFAIETDSNDAKVIM